MPYLLWNTLRCADRDATFERGPIIKLPQTGGCQCGKVCYEITEEPQLVCTYHYLNCQRLTSSAFLLGVVVPDVGFRASYSRSRTHKLGRVHATLRPF